MTKKCHTCGRAAQITDPRSGLRFCSQACVKEYRDSREAQRADVANVVTLSDKDRGKIHLTIRGGVVTGAMGSDPQRYIGKTLDEAKHIARYGGIKKPKIVRIGSRMVKV